jgi:amino acid adenylation domain-containing protein
LHLPETPGIEITVTEVLSNDSAKFDLNLIVIPAVEKIKGRESTTVIWEYSTDLFEPATIQRMMDHYVHILENAIADPDGRIADLSVLLPAERQQILIDWNQTTTEYPREKTIADLFELQAAQSPDAPAVRDATQALTYGELNRKSNQVAHYLQRFGVGPETTAGVAIPRSVEMVIALLAILKSGAAYVPLDVADPPHRISKIMEDAKPGVVLTLQAEQRLFAGTDQKCIRLDADWNQIAREQTVNLPSVSNGENLAYVIYTSGTTGQPKGVAVVHRGITRLVYNIRCIPLSTTDVVLQMAPVCFDVSAFEIWGTLLNGAQLVLSQEHLSLQEIADTIHEYHVTTVWLASALFSKMVAHNMDGLKTVKTLITGGDIVSRAAAEQARRHLSDVRIFNGYGPTEASMFSSFFEIVEATSFENNIPIGRPAQNTRIYILDEFRHPVPIRVKGELYIGGDGLARGYYQDPVLTECKFVQVPAFGRLYRTGDAARWLPDGTIDFLGRQDRQLKIRGFRIEPQEVEAALFKHPAVKEAAVVPVEDVTGDRKLVAYVVACEQKSIAIYELRTFLSEMLPAYMVPALYVFLDALPVSANGKVDRNALPPPDGERPDLSSHYVAPRNELERTIANIWIEVLERDRIGILDDFFELGGESLAAIRVVARIHNALGVHIPVRLIFEYPTISGLAQSLA